MLTMISMGVVGGDPVSVSWRFDTEHVLPKAEGNVTEA